jgi:hypothetical protein
MYILIAEDGSLSLEEADDMKGFSIIENGEAVKSSLFSSIAESAEDNHYWIDADSVIDLSPRGKDQQWIDDFWKMLKIVEAYGYSDLVNKRVKAHIESR